MVDKVKITFPLFRGWWEFKAGVAREKEIRAWLKANPTIQAEWQGAVVRKLVFENEEDVTLAFTGLRYLPR